MSLIFLQYIIILSRNLIFKKNLSRGKSSVKLQIVLYLFIIIFTSFLKHLKYYNFSRKSTIQYLSLCVHFSRAHYSTALYLQTEVGIICGHNPPRSSRTRLEKIYKLSNYNFDSDNIYWL